MEDGKRMEGRPIVRAGVIAIAVAGILCAAQPGRAQTVAEQEDTAASVAPLVPDRPDFTEGSSTVGRGVFQIEFGYGFGSSRTDGGHVRSHSLGEPLLRVGVLADWLELRVAASPVRRRTESGGIAVSDTGMEDLYLGVKFALSEQDGLLPATAILTQMTVPIGSAGFSDDRTLPGVNFVYGWDVTDNLSLAGGSQVNQAVGDDSDLYAEWAQSVTAGVRLGPRIGVYGEWFGFFPSQPASAGSEHYFDTGLGWLVTNDLQWDIRIGFGLNEPAENVLFGTGMSVRVR